MQFLDTDPKALTTSGSRGKADERDALRSNPNKWGVLSSIPKPADTEPQDVQRKVRLQALSRATTIRTGRGAWTAPADGKWEAAVQISADGSKYDVCARFVPNAVTENGDAAAKPTAEPKADAAAKPAAKVARG